MELNNDGSVHSVTFSNYPEPERQGFLTYSNYLKAVSQLVVSEYGDEPLERYSNVFTATANLSTKIGGKHVSAADANAALSNLRGAWNTLLLLEQQVQSTDGAFEIKNAWTPVQAWYAVHYAMSAIISVQNRLQRYSHSTSKSEAAKLIHDRRLLPYPWSMHVTCSWLDSGVNYDYRSFREPVSTNSVSNLSEPHSSKLEEHFAQLLRTTARQRCENKFDDARKARKSQGQSTRLSAEVKNSLCERVGSVTVFDFLYRLRLRANYGDVDTFVVACSPLEARHFTGTLLRIADATVASLEALLMRYLGKRDMVNLLQRVRKRHLTADLLDHRLNTWPDFTT